MLVVDDGEREWTWWRGGRVEGGAGGGKCGGVAEWSGDEEAGECLRSSKQI